MTDSQIFFIILYSIKKKHVQYERKSNLFGTNYILQNKPNLKNELQAIEAIDFQIETTSISSIVDLFRIKNILTGTVRGYEDIDYYNAFGDFVSPPLNKPNDLDLILDFWYQNAQIFKNENEYRDLIFKLTNDFEAMKNYKYQKRGEASSRKRSIRVFNYRVLGPISSEIILHIESVLGKPDFKTDLDTIINRLKDQGRNSYLINLALEIFKIMKSSKQIEWPKKISEKRTVKLLDEYYN